MAKAPRSLAGDVVAITGGARGIGRATAAALIAQGARVAIGDIDAALAERTAQELGSGTVGLPLDVTNRTSFATFLDEVENRLGALDVLINNAGIMPIGSFAEETDATAIRMIDINLHGVIYGSKLALERFIPRNRGHLVQIASIAGKMGFPGGATYCATKHAVVGLSESIRAELQGTNIELSVVMPVVVNTELGSGLAQTRGFKPVQPEDVADAIVEALQTGRFEVYVPKSIASMVRLAALTPRKAMEAVGRHAQGRPGPRAPRPPGPGGLRVADGRDDRQGPDAFGAGLARTCRRAGRRGRGRDERRLRRSASRRSARRSAVPHPPAGSGWRRRSRDRSRVPSAAANRCPVSSGSTGSESAHRNSFGRVSPRSASSTRCPAAAPGISGEIGRISGNARAPALDSALGYGAS